MRKAVLLTIWIALQSSVFGQTTDPAESLFDPANCVEIHLQFVPEEWEKLQPPGDVNWDFGEALQAVVEDAEAGRNFHSSKSSRPGLAGYMGVDHQYGRAAVTIDGETIHGVGVRYKGNGTFMAGHETGKYSFKIDFSEFQDGIEFRGLKKINLNNNVTDPSMLREALSYELFREVGVPASRTGWARVFLTVKGETDRKFLGLYLLVEQVDKRFLKRVYGSSNGLLVKPSTFGAFRYFGDDWNKYEAAYVPKTEASPEQKIRLMGFARLIHKASNDEFEADIADYLDMGEFLDFLAVNVILSNLDSFLGGSQNYYAYLDPTTHRFQLLPWDLDISFGAFEMLGTPDSRRDLSIDRPQVGYGSNRLIERVLAISEYRQGYRDRVAALLKSMFDETRMRERIDRSAEFLRPLIAEEGDETLRRFEASLSDSPPPGSQHAIRYFVRKRRESIQAQLSGQSQGQHLSWESNSPFEDVASWIAYAIAALLALVMNAAAWMWGMIAGYRVSTKWGLRNAFLYPIAPVVFGFHSHKQQGRAAAIMVLCSVSMLVAVAAVIVATS